MNRETYNLVFMAHNGNAEAFGELYNMYAKEMYSYACSMVKNSDLAQDAVQDAVMTAFKEIKGLRQMESFKGWLFKILNASCRRQYTKSMENLPIIDEYDYSEESDEPCTTETENTELSVDLKNALSILSEEDRNIVMLRVVYEYDSREIAAMLDMSDSTVRSKLRRSLEKLRRHMGMSENAELICG